MSEEGFEAVARTTDHGTVIELRGTVNRSAKERLEEAYRDTADLEGEIVLAFSEDIRAAMAPPSTTPLIPAGSSSRTITGKAVLAPPLRSSRPFSAMA